MLNFSSGAKLLAFRLLMPNNSEIRQLSSWEIGKFSNVQMVLPPTSFSNASFIHTALTCCPFPQFVPINWQEKAWAQKSTGSDRKPIPRGPLRRSRILTDVAQETAVATKCISEVILVKQAKGFTVQRSLNILGKWHGMTFSPQEVESGLRIRNLTELISHSLLNKTSMCH